MINTIMLFAAGLGTRMLHMTKNVPKPLLLINNKPILYYALELCQTFPFKRIIINTHYLADQINESVKNFKLNNLYLPEIFLIHEEILLDTGGAVKNILHLLGEEDALFTLNTDIIIKSKLNIFENMMSSWDPQKMDFLVLIYEKQKSKTYRGIGDFYLMENGKVTKPQYALEYPYVYTGLQIVKSSIISKNEKNIFSFSEYYQQNNDKIFGKLIEDLKWHHVGTVEEFEKLRA